MRFKLQAGAEVDVLSEAEYRAGIEELSKQVADLRGEFRARPLVRRIEAQDKATAGGLLTLQLGTPRLRYEWEVRRYTVCGPDPNAVVACSSIRVYRSEVSPFNLVDLDDGSPRIIPAVSTWGRDELTLLAQEPLLFVFVGLPANQTIYIAGQVVEFPADERRKQ